MTPQQKPPSRPGPAAAPGPGPDIDLSVHPCDISRPTRTVKVRQTGTDDRADRWWVAKRTVGYGWQVLQQAASLSPDHRWVLDIGEGDFDLPNHTLRSSLSWFTVRGKGAGLTRLRGTGDGHWQLWIHDCEGFCLEDLHLDVDTSSTEASGVTLLSVDCARVSRVRFQPIRFWGLRIGDADGPPSDSTIPPSSRVRVSDCVFADHRGDSTQESLLAIGIHDLEVVNCRFERIDGGAIAIGLWQAVSSALIQGCTMGGTGTGSVFGISLQDITFRGCSFANRNGIRGGVHSDLEYLGDSLAQGVHILGCDFSSPQGIEHFTEGNGLDLYSAEGVRVVGCTFSQFFTIPVVLGGATTVQTVEGEVQTVHRPAPRDVQLVDCTFECSRLGSDWQGHPEILIHHVLGGEEGTGLVGLSVQGCTFLVPQVLPQGDPGDHLRWQAIALRAPLHGENAVEVAVNQVGISWMSNTIKGSLDLNYPHLAVIDEESGAYSVHWSGPRDGEWTCS